MTTKSLYVSASQLAGTGTIITKGIVTDGSLVFNTPSNVQTLMDGNVTINVDMSNTANLGNLGTGNFGPARSPSRVEPSSSPTTAISASIPRRPATEA